MPQIFSYTKITSSQVQKIKIPAFKFVIPYLMITTSKWHWPLFLCPFVDYFKYVLYFKTALILKNLKPLVRFSPNTKSCMGMKCRPKWCRKHCSKATVSLRLLRFQFIFNVDQKFPRFKTLKGVVAYTINYRSMY